MTADIIFKRDPVHNNAFSFVKVYIFTRFGLAFTLKRSNGGLGSKKKSSRKQRLIVLMRAGKKEDSQNRWRQSLWHFYRRNRRTLCMQASPRASSHGGAGMGEGKDLIGHILTAQHQRSHRGFWGGIQIYETPVQALLFLFSPPPYSHSAGRACSQAICGSKNALTKYRHRTLDALLLAKGKERVGFIKPNWCRRVLTLSILCHYKTYKKILIVCFLFFCMCSCLHVASACTRYRRRINDISLGLIVLFSKLCHAFCWRNVARMKFFQYKHRKSSSTF